MDPDNLVQKLAALVEHPDAGFAWSPTLIIDDHGRVADFFPDVTQVEPYMAAPDFMDVLLPVGEVVMSSVVMRTSAIRQIGGFDPRTTLVGDWLTWMRMAMRFGVVTIPYALVRYRQHEECGSYRAKDGRMALEGPAVLREALGDPLFPAPLRAKADIFMAQLLVNEMWGLTPPRDPPLLGRLRGVRPGGPGARPGAGGRERAPRLPPAGRGGGADRARPARPPRRPARADARGESPASCASSPACGPPAWPSG